MKGVDPWGLSRSIQFSFQMNWNGLTDIQKTKEFLIPPSPLWKLKPDTKQQVSAVHLALEYGAVMWQDWYQIKPVNAPLWTEEALMRPTPSWEALGRSWLPGEEESHSSRVWSLLSCSYCTERPCAHAHAPSPALTHMRTALTELWLRRKRERREKRWS